MKWLTHLVIADHHGPPKVNCWQDSLGPSKWKEEHVSVKHVLKIRYCINWKAVILTWFIIFIIIFLQFVIVSLSSWSLLFFSGYKFFTGGKGNKQEVLFPVHIFWWFLLWFQFATYWPITIVIMSINECCCGFFIVCETNLSFPINHARIVSWSYSHSLFYKNFKCQGDWWNFVDASPRLCYGF